MFVVHEHQQGLWRRAQRDSAGRAADALRIRASPQILHGIDEKCRIDRCMHSLFGASKVAADVVAQEYGRYFRMNVGIFRGGCLTGPSHSRRRTARLSFVSGEGDALTAVTIGCFGYKGKQVRDNIHCSTWCARSRPSPQPAARGSLQPGWRAGEQRLDAGGDRAHRTDDRTQVDLAIFEEARKGDHICYISDLASLRITIRDGSYSQPGCDPGGDDSGQRGEVSPAPRPVSAAGRWINWARITFVRGSYYSPFDIVFSCRLLSKPRQDSQPHHR